MKKLLLASAAATFLAVPAHAQLLGGGGGLTGGLGSALDINSTISRTTETVRKTTRGAVNGSAATEGDQSVDRRSGRVEARRNADIAGAANVVQIAETPIAPMGASASGNGSTSGNGEAQAQLFGTDAVRSVAGSATGQASATASGAQSLAGSAVGGASAAVDSMTGNLPSAGSVSGEGSASGSGEGSASLTSMPLAVAGSAAGAASGAAAITPGMPVFASDGSSIGAVEEIVANSRGQVEQVIVSNGEVMQTIPAAELAASGDALIAGSGNAQAGAGSPDEEPAA